ncbi:Negative regulator of type III secretion [Chlamydiales bacterium STE3]|nr:Negative regulator of type III secretion [Chlamydiales bacterium STE3]
MADLNIGNSPSNEIIAGMMSVGKDKEQELQAEQQSSIDAFKNQQQETVNPMARALKKEKPIKAQKSRIQKMLESKGKEERLLPLQLLKDMADQFQRRNPELKANVLVLLRESIKPTDTKEEILQKLLEFYSDVSLADEALEYLIETSDGELARKLLEVKQELNEERGREIAAGRNINLQARQASERGLGTPTSMRDMYRDITGNPRDSTVLYEELSQKYTYKDLKKVIDFLLHSLGADMKAKGPSIDRGQLHRLFTETRSLQAILGVYRYFKGRMPAMQTLFENNELDFPQNLSFESMTKEFMSLAAERYPSADKVLQRSFRLGLENTVIGKIIALNQFRDAVREVAVEKILKTFQHRDELYLAVLDALEALEDELEELEENEIDNEQPQTNNSSR